MRVRYVLCAVAALGGAALAIAVGSQATTARAPIERTAAVTSPQRPPPRPANNLAVRPAPSSPNDCRGGAAPQDPITTAERFLETAVARANPGQGYALATRDLRGRTTCRDWVEGRLPVIAYRGIDWTRSNYRVVAAGEGQLVLRVVLFGKRSLPRAFLLELRRDGGAEQWLVGTWLSVPLQSLERFRPKAQSPGPAS
jgi:hypothetical protein